MSALMSLRKEIRAFALEHKDEAEMAVKLLPEDLQLELQRLTEALLAAKEKKVTLSDQVQESRAEFDGLMLALAAS
ncbi:hypothetical protein JCM19232_3813 [Vibrio ishigakensis]|uniref:Uncharacterized protein n=1 Tax=Vibrio ishigakensis TaxID=1481914 RepID=A0A0B8P3S4_9VIBR|nr:hypothetical protein JCM19232_3813 [Vibrio ishigakensis]GAM66881.1 hypothetical protein JCM19236_3211 [Vibrio sp. JCM 19236]